MHGLRRERYISTRLSWGKNILEYGKTVAFSFKMFCEYGPWCLFSEKSICEAEDLQKVSICSLGNISEVLKWFYVIFMCYVSKGMFTQHSFYAFWLFIYTTTEGLGAWKHQLLKTEVQVFENDAIILSICTFTFYIYAFSRHFYPKRLTLHSSYCFYMFTYVNYKTIKTHLWKKWRHVHAYFVFCP